MASQPAIGLLELTSIARGIVAADAMAKRAPVRLLQSQTICPGKYLVLIGGDEDPVRDAMDVGIHYAGAYLVDRLVIPNLHPQVIPALAAVQPLPGLASVGVIETFSVAATVVAADAACKAAEVTLIEVRLGNGLGGKAYVTMSGEQFSVEAALEAGVAAVESGLVVRSELIPAPHGDLGRALL
jgi:microcompartment protein CcmL/EutN